MSSSVIVFEAYERLCVRQFGKIEVLDDEVLFTDYQGIQHRISWEDALPFLIIVYTQEQS